MVNNEHFISFLLWQKIYDKGNLWNSFKDFLNEKVDKDKKEILGDWKKIQELLEKIDKKLRLDK